MVQRSWNDDLRQEFKALMTLVVRSSAPREAETFEKLAPSVLLQATQARANAALKNVSYEFSGVAEVGSVAIHLVAGTLALLDLYIRRKDQREQREFEYGIQEEWKSALIAAGVSPELARQIPLKYSPDLIKFLGKYRLGRNE